MSLLAAFGRKSIAAIDRRIRLQGVHTLGFGHDAPLDDRLRHNYSLAKLLCRGGKFIPTPLPNLATSRLDLDACISGFERRVRLRYMFPQRNTSFNPTFHVPNPNFQPQHAPLVVEEWLTRFGVALRDMAALAPISWRGYSNISPKEREALRWITQHNDIIVKPADKNLGLTLIHKEWYVTEIRRQLSDTRFYADVTDTADVGHIHASACSFVRQLPSSVAYSERKFLAARTAEQCTLPSFYILPKLHKVPVVGRPIVASHSWVTTAMSKWVAFHLNKLMVALPTVLSDTRSLLPRLDAIAIPPGQSVYLITADVSSLYTNIPIDSCLMVVGELLIGHPLERPLMNALRFVLRNNYFEALGRVYHQVDGIAMGTPLAPPLANIFMAAYERRLSRRLGPLWPCLYVRYIDDIFAVVVGSRHHVDTFVTGLHGMSPHITLSVTVSSFSVEYLDLVVSVEGSRLQYEVHQKVLNRYLYISPFSYHPRHVFTGFIKTELFRYLRNSSTLLGFLRITHQFFLRLRDRGFHAAFLRPIFASVTYDMRTSILTSSHVRDGHGPVVLVVPYTPQTANANFHATFTEYRRHMPSGFRETVGTPMVCYTVGRSLYSHLVRARAP